MNRHARTVATSLAAGNPRRVRKSVRTARRPAACDTEGRDSWRHPEPTL